MIYFKQKISKKKTITLSWNGSNSTPITAFSCATTDFVAAPSRTSKIRLFVWNWEDGEKNVNFKNFNKKNRKIEWFLQAIWHQCQQQYMKAYLVTMTTQPLLRKKVCFFIKFKKNSKNSTKKKSLLLIDQYTIHVMVFAPLFIFMKQTKNKIKFKV